MLVNPSYTKYDQRLYRFREGVYGNYYEDHVAVTKFGPSWRQECSVLVSDIGAWELRTRGYEERFEWVCLRVTTIREYEVVHVEWGIEDGARRRKWRKWGKKELLLKCGVEGG